MEKEKIVKIIKQVLYKPQVAMPPISYKITEKSGIGMGYSSKYIDIEDFESYIIRLEKQLIYRLTE